jgi:hypothetical protein
VSKNTAKYSTLILEKINVIARIKAIANQTSHSIGVLLSLEAPLDTSS